MKTIYKYPVDNLGNITLLLPQNAEILTVQSQGERLCIWAIVDTEVLVSLRKFCVRATGQPLDGKEGAYIGTFQLLGGEFIGHLFEAKE